MAACRQLSCVLPHTAVEEIHIPWLYSRRKLPTLISLVLYNGILRQCVVTEELHRPTSTIKAA